MYDFRRGTEAEKCEGLMIWLERYMLVEGLLGILPQKLRGGEAFFQFELVFLGGICLHNIPLADSDYVALSV